MMKQLKPLLMVMLVSFALYGYSQELPRHVFSSGGDHHKTTVVELSWTIGQAEPETTTYHPDVILSSGFQQQDDLLVSVQEQEEKTVVRLFPNPCNELAHLELSFDAKTDVCYSLYDLYGRLIQQEELKGQRVYYKLLDLADVPPGIYNLLISTGIGYDKPFKSIKIIRN